MALILLNQLKKLVLLILLTLNSFIPIVRGTLKAQDRLIIDSLQNELRQFKANKNELGKNVTSLMDTTKADILYGIVFQYLRNPHDTGIYYSRQILDLSEQIGYKKGIGNAYNAFGLISMGMQNYPAALNYYQKSLEIRTIIGDKKGIAGTYNNLGLFYGKQGDFEEEIKYHLKSLKVKEEIRDREGMAASYGKIGHAYSCLGKFPEAISNYLYALNIDEEDSNKIEISGAYGDIGDVYYNEGNYPEALKNYLKDFNISSKYPNSFTLACADVAMGRIYYKLGNDTGAIKYFLYSLKINEKFGNKPTIADIYDNLGLVYIAVSNYPMALSSAESSLKENENIGSELGISKATIEIGSIYEKQGNLKDALDAVTKGLSLAKEIKARVLMQDAYRHLMDIDAELHDYKSAYEAHKEYDNNLDSISSNESVQKIATMQMNYEFTKKEDSIREEYEKENIIKTTESKRKNIITGSAVVISLLTLILAAVLINRQQLKRKKDKIIFEKEKQQIESELANAKIILDEYIQNMEEKNKLLEEFKFDLEGFKTLQGRERTENLAYLNKATILTNEDWYKFKELFEQAHKNFFNRLKEKLPDLTQSEIRLICLTKLAIGTKQMAGILGVSADTIKVSRHRLRKKLGLSEEETLENVVNSI